MAQPQLLQVKLSRFDAQPWGFRLQGGTDFAQPLLVQKVSEGGSSGSRGGSLPHKNMYFRFPTRQKIRTNSLIGRLTNGICVFGNTR